MAASSLADGDRAYSHCPGATWSLMARSPASFSSLSVSTSGTPVDHGAAVVDGVLEHRTGQHQPVDMGHGHTRRHRLAGGAEAPTGHRSMEKEPVVDGGRSWWAPPSASRRPPGPDGRRTRHRGRRGDRRTPVRSLFGDPAEAGPFRHRHLAGTRIAGWGRFGHDDDSATHASARPPAHRQARRRSPPGRTDHEADRIFRSRRRTRGRRRCSIRRPERRPGWWSWPRRPTSTGPWPARVGGLGGVAGHLADRPDPHPVRLPRAGRPPPRRPGPADHRRARQGARGRPRRGGPRHRGGRVRLRHPPSAEGGVLRGRLHRRGRLFGPPAARGGGGRSPRSTSR